MTTAPQTPAALQTIVRATVDALGAAVHYARTVDHVNVGRDPRALIGPNGMRVNHLVSILTDLAPAEHRQATVDAIDHYLDLLGYWAGDMALAQVMAADSVRVALGVEPTPHASLVMVADIIKADAYR